MPDWSLYGVYDFKRDRFAHEFEAASDERARVEFSRFYNETIGPARWEARKFGRYFLYRLGQVVDGREVHLDRYVRLMDDDAVRLSYDLFWFSDPPGCEADMAEIEAEFDRLDGLDAARLARRGNQAA